MKDTEQAVVGLMQRTNLKGEAEYLFIQPNPDHRLSEHTHKYRPPSGHILEGETEEEALVREMEEEIGVKVKPVRRIATTSSDIAGGTLNWWECTLISQDLVMQQEEIVDIKWFSLDEIKKMDLWPATKKFFQEYIFKDG